MKWLKDLPEKDLARVLDLQGIRDFALCTWYDGFMPKDVARAIVAWCNREIRRIADSRRAAV